MKRVIHLLVLASMLVTAALPALPQVGAHGRAQYGGGGIEAPVTAEGADVVADMAAIGWYEGTWLLAQEGQKAGAAALMSAGMAHQAELRGDWSNTAALACITPLGIVHNAALGAGLVAPPPADFQPAMAEYAANLALKYCAPAVFPAPDFSVLSAYDADMDECGYTFAQERTQGEYKNFLGLTLPWGNVFPGKEWGQFDQPAVVHFNTDVKVTVDSEQWVQVIDFSVGDDAEPSANHYWLPVGVHNMVWRGDTQITLLDYLPKYVPGAFWTKLGKLVKLRAVVQSGLEQALERGIDFAATFLEQPQLSTGMYNEETQRVAVRDTMAPQLTGNSTASVEAIEPDGVSRQTYLSLLLRMVLATDNCDAAPVIIADNESSLPTFAAVGSSYTVNRVAEDRGPKDLSGARNRSAPLQQTFTVRDTLLPLVLAPPDIVMETTSLPAVIELGHAATFDLADLNPTVSHNACSLAGVVCNGAEVRFPAGARSVTWTATDHVGLTATATQVVNVKAPGSNHVSTAEGQSGSNAVEAISYEPVTITLWAQDADVDPLWFHIEEQPDDGFFHAPLYPYFIQDYRLANVQDIDFSDYCEDPDHRQQYVPTNWPIDASFMAVVE